MPTCVLAAGAGAPPSLNVDVPRMLLREYHHRINRCRGRRQHQLEQLLKRPDLPVGHGRVGVAAWHSVGMFYVHCLLAGTVAVGKSHVLCEVSACAQAVGNS